LNTSTPNVSTDALTFRLLQLNCYACHDRNQLGGVGRFRKPYFETLGHVDIGDEGRLPPTLTGAGDKLTASWIDSVLAGKGRVRPFMSIRMPVFPAEATKRLSAMFENADTSQIKSQDSDRQSAAIAPKTLVEAGRRLMDTGCVQCHAFKGEALPGTIGVDLEGVTQRIRRSWLRKFLKDPGALKARTRMPTFFPNGQSQNPDVLSGDVELQIAAMDAYLSELSHQPLPEKIQQARDQNYELKPTDHPIVLRTFMPVAGMHAIAVGFPQSVHFAFDAEHIAVSQAWRGRFLDAEGTWFIRFAPPAEPLGDQRITFPPGICIAVLTDMTMPWPNDAEDANAEFSGYRLDKNRVPEFLYSVHGVSVTDRTEPDGKRGLKRTIRFRVAADTDAPEMFWFRAHMGTELIRTSPRSFVNEAGLTVTLDQPETRGDTRSVAGITEWLVPIVLSGETVVRVQYTWK
ncbi:MAG: c-type cytochrome, partial [Planctomycetaceae bacterium]|nr:c-type cytochrome [Planctomycetaceae bacterium]